MKISFCLCSLLSLAFGGTLAVDDPGSARSLLQEQVYPYSPYGAVNLATSRLLRGSDSDDTSSRKKSTKKQNRAASQPASRKEPKSPKTKAPTDSMDGEPASRREITRVRTTLNNVDVDDLTPEEVIFYEDTWKSAFNEVFSQEDEDEASGPRTHALLVESIEAHNSTEEKSDMEDPGHHRALASHWYRYRNGGYWWDIYAYLEFTCRFCYPTRRRLSDQTTHHQFEEVLLVRLKEGPFEAFHNLDGCAIVYE